MSRDDSYDSLSDEEGPSRAPEEKKTTVGSFEKAEALVVQAKGGLSSLPATVISDVKHVRKYRDSWMLANRLTKEMYANLERSEIVQAAKWLQGMNYKGFLGTIPLEIWIFGFLELKLAEVGRRNLWPLDKNLRTYS